MIDEGTAEEILRQELQRSKSLVSWIDENLQILHEIEFDKDSFEEEPYLVIDCLAIAREHHKGVVHLVDKDIIGPATSLVRVALEAFYRGVWLHRCAKPEDWKRFRRDGGVARQMHKMMDDIRRVEGTPGRTALSQKAWEHIGRLPHAGMMQIILTPLRQDGTSAVLRKRHTTAVLSLVNGVGIQAGLYTGIVLVNETILRTFMAKLKEHQAHCENFQRAYS